MKNNDLIFLIDNDRLLTHFIEFAINEYGSLKINDIQSKLNNSNGVIKFLFECKRLRIVPGSDDFLACIHSSRYFMFSKAEIISITSIMLMIKWKNEVAYELGHIDDNILNKRLLNILDKCDKYKLHLKYGNFFERYHSHLDELLIETMMAIQTTRVKDEVEFESTLFNAANKFIKREFRTMDNLDYINYDPDAWELVSYDSTKAALFRNRHIGKSFSVDFPYIIGSNLKIKDESSPEKILTDMYVTNCTVQRIRDVTQSQAVREGYGEYKEKINELYDIDPALDAELALFKDHWCEIYGAAELTRNQWLWIITFSSRSWSVTTKELSDEQMRILLSCEI